MLTRPTGSSRCCGLCARALPPPCRGKLIVLFGCGGDRDKTKRPLMGATACKYADTVIVTSDNPRSEEPMRIIGDILKGTDKKRRGLFIEEDRRRATALALSLAKPGDTVLLAGKGHEKYQLICGEKLPLDERETVREILGLPHDTGRYREEKTMNTIAALIMGLAAAVLVTALLGFAVIPWLRKLHFGQTILDIGPKWHEKKQGTPTMGGIMFILGTIAAVAVTVVTDKLVGGNIVASSATGAPAAELYTKFYSGIIFALGVALIGFADDYIKVVKKRNLGLTEKQKTLLQIFVIAAYLTSLYMSMGNKPYMFIPFVGNVQMGIFFWIFGFAVIYAAINAVNFVRSSSPTVSTDSARASR